MAVKIKHIDLFDYIKELQGSTWITHCISNDWALGAGFAKLINNKYNVRANRPKTKTTVGVNYLVATDQKDLYVMNMITKDFYYNKPTLDTLELCLSRLRNIVINNSPDNIVMPKIGCGLDKLDWEKVEPLIYKYLDDLNVNTTVCLI